MPPAHQLQADTISPDEQASVDSWIPGQEDDPVAGKACLKQHCLHDRLLTFITSRNAKTFSSYHKLGVLCLQVSACSHTMCLGSKQQASLGKDIFSLHPPRKRCWAAGSQLKKIPQLQVRPVRYNPACTTCCSPSLPARKPWSLQTPRARPFAFAESNMQPTNVSWQQAASAAGQGQFQPAPSKEACHNPLKQIMQSSPCFKGL